MNVVFLNDVVMVPTYDEDIAFESEAIRLWETYTNKKIITIKADKIVKDNGAVHCITKTIPQTYSSISTHKA